MAGAAAIGHECGDFWLNFGSGFSLLVSLGKTGATVFAVRVFECWALHIGGCRASTDVGDPGAWDPVLFVRITVVELKVFIVLLGAAKEFGHLERVTRYLTQCICSVQLQSSERRDRARKLPPLISCLHGHRSVRMAGGVVGKGILP